ncbi:WXG100 family type VII secretion target [Streptomyces sp. NPDC001339]|uniref:WXG100 family type VII secretion target n=1 Tax=Streptomyces sp. NPDC001339 TaxID=3364563 RepID=UPI0036A0B801
MSASDKVKEVVQDLTGMWFPEGDEDELREAARAWRTYVDDIEDCTAAAHKSAQDVIDNNKGQSIEAFSSFWRKYHGGGKGYLDDLASAARDMAKALDKFADQIAEAKSKIKHELEIAGAVLVAGTALAVFTGGITEVAAVGAAETIAAAASAAGVAVSATVAEIAGTVLATAAIGGLDAITVDVVVAQGGRNLLGEQSGINLAEIKDAGVTGVLMGGAIGGAARTARAISRAGGLKTVLRNFDDIHLESLGFGSPRLATAGGGHLPRGSASRMFRTGNGDEVPALPPPPRRGQLAKGNGGPSLEQVRKMRDKRKRWSTGEDHVRKMYGGQPEKHYPVPTNQDPKYPVTARGGRKVDVPVQLPDGRTLGLEVKTYQQYRMVEIAPGQHAPQQVEVPLSKHIKEQIHKDIALRRMDPGFDPRWVFLHAGPSQELREYLKEAGIIFVEHH